MIEWLLKLTPLQETLVKPTCMAFYPSSFGYLSPFKSRISQIWCLRHEPPQFLMVKYSFNDPNSWFFFHQYIPHGWNTLLWLVKFTIEVLVKFYTIRDVFFKHFINFIQHFPAEIHQKHRFIMIYLFCSSLEKKQFRSSHVCYLNPWLSSDFCGLNSPKWCWNQSNPIPLKSMISPNPNIFGA